MRNLQIYKLMILLILLFCQFSIAVGMTRTELIASVRSRGIDIDSERCPDTIFHDWIIEESIDIAVWGSAIETDTSYKITLSDYSYPLPSDFYLFRVAILNSDPQEPTGPYNREKKLKYRPYEEYGEDIVKPVGRPTECYIGDNQFHIERLSGTGLDTIFLNYYAYPTPITADTSVIRLPQKFEKLLIDRLTIKFYNRVKMPSNQIPAELKQEILYLESKLLGRPEDDDK